MRSHLCHDYRATPACMSYLDGLRYIQRNLAAFPIMYAPKSAIKYA
jgi:hypothetical protein